MKATVLVVDDEQPLLEGLTYSLQREGFQVLAALDGDQALEQARLAPDLILLDVMLPGTDGLEVCRSLRERGVWAPILLVSSRDQEIDKVVGLEVGADDYVTKPFSTRELVARIRAHLRRARRLVDQAPAPLRVGPLVIDLSRRSVEREGVRLELTPREFDLLLYLARHPDQVVPRERLIEQVWGFDFEGESQVLHVAIGRLRDKVEHDPAHPRLIVTVRGVGYRLESL